MQAHATYRDVRAGERQTVDVHRYVPRSWIGRRAASRAEAGSVSHPLCRGWSRKEAKLASAGCEVRCGMCLYPGALGQSSEADPWTCIALPVVRPCPGSFTAALHSRIACTLPRQYTTMNGSGLRALTRKWEVEMVTEAPGSHSGAGC